MVQIIHDVVIVVETARIGRVMGEQHIADGVRHRHGDLCHLREVRGHFVRDDARGMTPSRCFGDVDGESTHAVDIGDDVRRGDNRS